VKELKSPYATHRALYIGIYEDVKSSWVEGAERKVYARAQVSSDRNDEVKLRVTTFVDPREGVEVLGSQGSAREDGP